MFRISKYIPKDVSITSPTTSATSKSLSSSIRKNTLAGSLKSSISVLSSPSYIRSMTASTTIEKNTSTSNNKERNNNNGRHGRKKWYKNRDLQAYGGGSSSGANDADISAASNSIYKNNEDSDADEFPILEEEEILAKIEEDERKENQDLFDDDDMDEDISDEDEDIIPNLLLKDNKNGPLSAHENPYISMTHNYFKRVVNPPGELARGIESILQGRNVTALNIHWHDMRRSLKERNVSLMNSVKQAEKLAIAQQAGNMLEIPSDTISTDSPPLLYGPNETLAYVLHGLLPSYGIAKRLFDEVTESLPHFQPKNMLDFGCGPGTAVYAAQNAWPDTLFDFVVVEPSRSMMQVSEHLLADVPGVMYRRNMEEVHRHHRGKKFDLVVAHYALGELTSDKERDNALVELWNLVSPGGMLLLSEHGDRWGFHVIRRSRDSLLFRASAVASLLPQLEADMPLLGATGMNNKKLGNNINMHQLSDGNFDTNTNNLEELYKKQQKMSSSRSGIRWNSSEDENSDSTNTIEKLPKTLFEDHIHKENSNNNTENVNENGEMTLQDMDIKRNLPSIVQIKKYLKEYTRKHKDQLGHVTGRMLRPGDDVLDTVVVGPCPHAKKCPMAQNSWCHFSQAVARHRKAGRSVHTRGIAKRWEKYSYVILRKVDKEGIKEHPPHSRAGWEGTGAFSIEETGNIDNEGDILSDDDIDNNSGNKKNKKNSIDKNNKNKNINTSIDALSTDTTLHGSTKDSIPLTRKNLEPDVWWLTQRPNKYTNEEHTNNNDQSDSENIISRKPKPGQGVYWDRDSDNNSSNSGDSDDDYDEVSPRNMYEKKTNPSMKEVLEVGKIKNKSSFSKTQGKAAFENNKGKKGKTYSTLDNDSDEDYEDNSGDDDENTLDDGEDMDEEEDREAKREELLEIEVARAIKQGLPGAGQWARLVRSPLKRDGHVVLDVCTPQGTFERRVASKGKLKEFTGAYRAARKARWGALWPNWIARRRNDFVPLFKMAALPTGITHPLLTSSTNNNVNDKNKMMKELPLLDTDQIYRPAKERNPNRPSRSVRRRAAMKMVYNNVVTEEEKEKLSYSLKQAQTASVEVNDIANQFIDNKYRRLDASGMLSSNPKIAKKALKNASSLRNEPVAATNEKTQKISNILRDIDYTK